MSARAAAWTVWGVAMAFTAAGLGLLAASFDALVPDFWGFRGFPAAFALSFGTLGALIVALRRNLVGWLLLVVGAASAFQVFAEEYAIYGVVARPGSVPAPEIFGWIESWIWVFVVMTGVIYTPLVFPDGRLRSPRWRVVVIAGGLAAVWLASVLALSEGPLNNAPFIRNPFGVSGVEAIRFDATGASIANATFYASYGALFACAAVAIWSLVGRFRGASGAERQQIKWFAFGGGMAALAMMIGGYFQAHKAAQVLFILSIQLVPVTMAVAILRHRLYDIDLVINRTLVYGATTALLGATFVGVELVLQPLLHPLLGGSELAVAASTLLTLGAFHPLRRRVQDVVDRRFYRSRYDAGRTLDAFTSRLRDEVDLDQVRADLLEVIGTTVRPAHAGVWLRGVRPHQR